MRLMLLLIVHQFGRSLRVLQRTYIQRNVCQANRGRSSSFTATLPWCAPPHTRAHIPRHTSVPALLDVWRKYHRKVLAVLLPPTSYGVRQCRPAIWRIVTTCSPSRDLAGSWIKWVYGFFAAVMRRTEVHTHAHTLSRAASGIHL